MIFLAFLAVLLVSLAVSAGISLGVAWALGALFGWPFWPVAVVTFLILILVNGKR